MKRFILEMGFLLIGSKQILIRYAKGKKKNSEVLLFKSVDLLFLLVLVKINNVLVSNAKKIQTSLESSKKPATFFCCLFNTQFYIGIAGYLLLGYHHENLFIV